MQPRTLIPVAAIALLIGASMAQPVSASSIASGYTINLDGDHFRVTWTIDAQQNLTALSKTIVFPQNLTTILTGADLTAFTSAFQTALQSKIPSVQATQLTVSLASTGANVTCSFRCPLQWLNATISFNVRETPARTFGNDEYDMGWKAIRLGDDLRAGGVAFNTLGQTYLLQAMPAFFPTPSRMQTITVKVGGLLVSKQDYQDPTRQIVLLDTSAFQTPLQDWVHTLDITTGTQTWSSPDNAGFNITALEQIIEVDLTTNIYYYAAARVSAELSAPLNAIARGDILIVDPSNGLWEKIASATIVVAMAALIATTILERRITGSLRRQRRAKKNR